MTHSFNHYDQLARQAQTALYLYVDIETIPSQDRSVLEAIGAKHVVPEIDFDAIEADKRLTDPEKIQADIRKKNKKAITDRSEALIKADRAIEDEYRRTALDASTGHIVCACVALGDDDIASAEVHDPKHFTLQHEREMLEDLFAGLDRMLTERAQAEASKSLEESGRLVPSLSTDDIRLEVQRHRQVPVVVAHHAQFDIRYIWQRAIILGVTPPAWWPIDARPWDTDRVYDTMTAWAGHGNRIGLDRLCRALGLEGKTGVDGSMVWDLVREGRIEEVVEYCADDVRRLRSVHRRMLGLPVLEIDVIEAPAEVPTEGDGEESLEDFVRDVVSSIPLDFKNATNAAGEPRGYEP